MDKVGIFIGRFQPFHSGHKEVVEKMLKDQDHVLILIGSFLAPTTIKNPFTFQERRDMILSCFSDNQKENIHILPLRDSRYQYNEWLTNVQATVNSFGFKSNQITLYGHFKDDTSFYLNDFPQWDFVNIKSKDSINATDIRESLFDESITYDKILIPSTVDELIKNWINDNKELFNNLKEEYSFIKKYKKQWENSPYPPTFVTTDCVVYYAGHVLLIKRKINPGKGKWALPGGFLNQDETIVNGMIRELKEETKINVSKKIIEDSIEKQKVFDHPKRDMRGRTITHGYFINLTRVCKELPDVRAADDASEAKWIQVSDIWNKESNFYADHLHIINYFINRY